MDLLSIHVTNVNSHLVSVLLLTVKVTESEERKGDKQGGGVHGKLRHCYNIIKRILCVIVNTGFTCTCMSYLPLIPISI